MNRLTENQITVRKYAKRAIRHIEIAWKLAREIHQIEPKFYNWTGGKNGPRDSAHAQFKPHYERLQQELRGGLKKIIGDDE